MTTKLGSQSDLTTCLTILHTQVPGCGGETAAHGEGQAHARAKSVLFPSAARPVDDYCLRVNYAVSVAWSSSTRRDPQTSPRWVADQGDRRFCHRLRSLARRSCRCR